MRKNPSTEGLDELVSSENFLQLYQEITCVKGDQDGMVAGYLRDVSSILELVSSVRGGNIELHLETERDMLKHLFAFHHQNYARYLSYQYVLLNDLKVSNTTSFQDLVFRGMGANYSDNKFASVHGDLVTEY